MFYWSFNYKFFWKYPGEDWGVGYKWAISITHLCGPRTQGRSKGGACGAAARNGVATGAQIWPKYHRLHPPPPEKGRMLRDEGAISAPKFKIFFWGAAFLSSARTIKTARYGPARTRPACIHYYDFDYFFSEKIIFELPKYIVSVKFWPTES